MQAEVSANGRKVLEPAGKSPLPGGPGAFPAGVRIVRQRGTLRERVTQDVRAGIALSAALRSARRSRPSVRAWCGLRGLRQPAEMLQSLATLYGEAGQARMKRPWYWIEPLAILLIGSGVRLRINTGVILAITSANDMVL